MEKQPRRLHKTDAGDIDRRLGGLSREAGFVTPVDLFVILVIVPLLAVSAWYIFKAAYRKHYEEPPQCLVRIEGIAKKLHERAAQGGMKPTDRPAEGYAQVAKVAGSTELTCPQTGVPYEIQGTSAKWRICCADPENHLGIGHPKSCRSEKGWHHTEGAGRQGTGKLPEVISVAILSPIGWRIAANASGNLHIERVTRWGRILLGIGIAFLLPYLGIFAASLMMNVKESKGLKTLKAWIIMPPAFAFAAACYMAFFAVLAGGVWLLLSSQRTTFAPHGMTLVSRTYPFHEKRVTVESKNLLAVGTDGGVLVAYRDPEGRLRAWRMRSTDIEEPRSLADELKRVLEIRAPL